MEPEAEALASEFGGDPAGHRSRYLSSTIAYSADLMLGMTREHRSRAVSLAPARVRQAFTIRELARLSRPLSDDEIIDLAGPTDTRNTVSLNDRLSRTFRALGTRRGITPPVAAELDDVIDPYRGSERVYRRSAEQLVPAVAETARILRAVTVGRTSSKTPNTQESRT